jgi:transposase
LHFIVPDNQLGIKSHILTRLEDKLMNNREDIFVGIDVSSEKLDVALYPVEKHWVITNNEVGINSLLEHLKALTIKAVVLEATGGLERIAVRIFRQAGYVVHVVNPRRIANFRRVVAVNAKTDRIDALLIARFAASLPLMDSFIASELQMNLRDLAARREQLVIVSATAKKQKIRIDSKFLQEGFERQIAFCKEELAVIERAMARLIQTDKEMSAQVKLLSSIPGVGELSAMLIIAELPEIGHLPAKKLASLVGVAPHLEHSGKRDNKAKIRGGRARIRSKCYIMAHNAIRYNPLLAQYATQLKKRGKSRKEIVIAAINKLLHIATAILKRQEPWKENLA